MKVMLLKSDAFMICKLSLHLIILVFWFKFDFPIILIKDI